MKVHLRKREQKKGKRISLLITYKLRDIFNLADKNLLFFRYFLSDCLALLYIWNLNIILTTN